MQSDRPTADDVAALQRHLGGEPPMQYVDLRQRAAVDEALIRWPWLLGAHRRRPDAGAADAGA